MFMERCQNHETSHFAVFLFTTFVWRLFESVHVIFVIFLNTDFINDVAKF